MNTPAKRAKSIALGKRVTRVAILLNTVKDIFHGKGRKGAIRYKKEL